MFGVSSCLATKSLYLINTRLLKVRADDRLHAEGVSKS